MLRKDMELEGRQVTWHRIAAIDASNVSGIGSVLVESYPDGPRVLPPVKRYIFLVWKGSSNYVRDGYDFLVTLPEFTDSVWDDSDISPEMGSGIPLGVPSDLSPFAVLNRTTWAWDVDLDAARTAHYQRLNTSWKEAEKLPFPAYGKLFDADDKAIQRMLGAAQAAMIAQSLNQPLQINWTTHDNSVLQMSTEMLVQMPLIIAGHADTLHQRYVSLKAQINEAQSLTEMEGIVW